MESNTQPSHSVETNIPQMVYCLSVDLIDSTESGLKLTTQKLDKFNISLVNQIKPHLENLGLTDALIKFTGDGWLVMTEKPRNVPSLCCLATIMAHRFQEEMNRQTGIPIDRIPPIRLAICGGRDICVELPDGRKDWIGDSVRRAVRISRLCSPNEILIDEPTRYLVLRDFCFNCVDTEQRVREHQVMKMEEELTLHVSGELRAEAAEDSEAPEYFVYTLDNIGKTDKANTVVQHISKQLEEEVKTGVTNESLQRILRSFHRLMNSISDYSISLNILENIRKAGLTPNVFTYSILVKKAPDYERARHWLDSMGEENIEPDVITYNTLISRAPDYDTAKEIVEEMQKKNIEPDVITYNTLISRAPNYDAVRKIVEEMKKENIEPNVITYSTLISRAPDYDTARTWRDEMKAFKLMHAQD